MATEVTIIVNRAPQENLKGVGQELGVFFKQKNNEAFDKNNIQAGNFAFSSMLSDGSFMGYGDYVAGPANVKESYDPNTLVILSTP